MTIYVYLKHQNLSITQQQPNMEYTAGQIASYLGGKIEGDSLAKVSRVAKIEEATHGTITFLANPAYTPYIYKTGASIVLVSENFVPEKKISSTIIRVKDPYGALAQLLELYKSSIPEKIGISSLAFMPENLSAGVDVYIGPFVYIGDNVKLGKQVKLHPHCYIGNNVTIGDNTVLYSGVRIYDDCVIGNNCTIHSNVVIGADGFGFAPQGENGLKKVEQIGNVVIEDHVEIGAGTAIDRATMGSTRIRKGVKLDNLIQIGHNVVIGENTVIAGQAGIAGSSKIGSNCMIGGQVGISGHLNIGNDVKIAAQSGVTSHVKDGQIIMGAPAFDASRFRKAFIHFRNLEKIVSRIDELEKSIKNLDGDQGLPDR
jgi:UDP-3-O-[3-hydroxymyristoyl] glucosamine N-acyltransferase